MKLPKLELALQKQTCKPALFRRVWSATRRTLNLEHSPHTQFACCQWQQNHRPATAYLVYRWLLFIGVLSVGIASFVTQQLPINYDGPMKLNYFKWFIYFTNWGYLFIALQSGLALAVVHRYRAEKNFNISGEDDENPIPKRKRTPLLCRAYWLTHIIATDLSFVITLIYWILVYDPKIHAVSTLNLLVHGGNSLIMLIELAVTAHPLRAAHALYGASAGLAYGIFSAFYWAVGGTDRIGSTAIYPALDWNKPGTAFGFVGLCAVVLVSAHAIAACLCALRIKMASRLRPARSHSDRLTLPTH
ncbi:protein rolling stone-like isoform X2 [Hyposmocoma kahamanoa]|uniref:protein rolling stone-like isoform X2 n=1 Tax=Hyposmocoma kahamanoa TaxID=1477025 RepID=UPI000E6D5DB0|nr:protein rolling stone-like isoform X2 [Hyposmocoma kahamanoa]